MPDYTDKIAELEQELSELADELDTPALLARKASLQRNLRWYRARTDRVITALGADLSENIHAGEST